MNRKTRTMVAVGTLAALVLTSGAMLGAAQGANAGAEVNTTDDLLEVCEPEIACFDVEECRDLQACSQFCIEGVGCGNFTSGIKYPAGAGAFDPWLDVRGDEIVGPLTMNDSELVFQGPNQSETVLSQTPGGQLSVDGEVLCVQGDPACTAESIQAVDCPAGEHVGAIREDGTARCDGEVADGAVDASSLTPAAVTTAKLNDTAVTGAKLADGAVTTPVLADLAVDTDKLAEAAVTHARLAPDAVTASTIRNGSVGSDEIEQDAVGQPELAPDAVTSSRVVDGTLDTADLANGSVATSKLASQAVTRQTIAAGAVDGAQLADGAVSKAKIGAVCDAGQVLAYNGTGWDCAEAAGSDEDTLAALDCASDAVTRYNGTSWVCSTDQDTTYNGSDFALSGQSCAGDTLVAGVNASGGLACQADADTTYAAGDGLVLDGTTFAVQACSADQVLKHDGTAWTCGADEDTHASSLPWSDVTDKPAGFADDVDDDTTYDGGDFALSDQACASGEHVAGIDASGTVVCDLDDDSTTSSIEWANVTDKPSGFADDVDDDTTYDGGDFALSDQSCATGEVVAGVNASGVVLCTDDRDTDSDTLAELDCASTEITRFDGSAWTCSSDQDTTAGAGAGLAEDGSGNLDVNAGDGLEIASGNVALDQSCSSSQILKFDGSAWGCAADEDTRTSSLSWSDVTDKPSGFADDADNDTLASLSCPSDRLAKYDGSAWTCAEDQDTDTTYDAGFGLSLSSTTFGVDTSTIQERVADTCSSGSSIRAIASDGSVTCEPDDGITQETDPTVNDLAKAPLDCGEGEVAKVNASSWTCRDDRGLVLNATTVVSPTGNDDADGHALLEAVASQPDLSDEPRVVFVEPGVYGLEDAKLQVPDGLKLVGSGPEATTIRGTAHTIVEMGNATALRSLAIENGRSASQAGGVNVSEGNAALEDVDVGVGKAGTVFEEAVGVRLLGGPDIQLQDTEIEVEAADQYALGIQVRGPVGDVELDGVSALATGDLAAGLEAIDGNFRVTDANLSAQGFEAYGLHLDDSAEATVRDTTLEGSDPAGTSSSTAAARTGGDLDLRQTVLRGGHQGLVVDAGSVNVTGSQLGATEDALYTSWGTVRVDDSRLDGNLVHEDGTTFVGGSRLAGFADNLADPGDLRCVSSYDDAYHSLDTSCQPQTT